MAAASDDLWQAGWQGADRSKTGWFGNVRGKGRAGPNMTSSRWVFMSDTFSSPDVESVTIFLGQTCKPVLTRTPTKIGDKLDLEKENNIRFYCIS